MLDIGRRQLDKKLAPLRSVSSIEPPSIGWLRSIRSALGLTLAQLAKRLNISPQTVQEIERSEEAGTITLKALKRSAEAMNCRLFYAIIPNETLQKTVDAQMMKKATQIAGYISHSMTLEDQKTDSDEVSAQIQRIMNDLKRNKNISHIWENDL
jgi:predicted DNA-binding mobile mystery protein A